MRRFLMAAATAGLQPAELIEPPKPPPSGGGEFTVYVAVPDGKSLKGRLILACITKPPAGDHRRDVPLTKRLVLVHQLLSRLVHAPL